MKIVYSKLKPEFIEPLVKVHRDTMKDHYNSRLGNFYTSEYLKWFSKDTEHNNFIICAFDEDDKRVIGYMCGAKEGFQSKMNRDLLFPTIVSFLLKPWLVIDKRFFLFLIPKFRTFLGLNEYDSSKEYEATLKQPVFSIVTFGIDSEYKAGMNLGFLILEDLYTAFFNELKRKGAGTVCATVRRENENIIRYYQFKKWTLSPVDVKNDTLFFYKEVI